MPEQIIFQPSETKLIRYVTPQEIMGRIGGNMALADDDYTTAIEFGHTEGLRILIRRAHKQAPEHLSSVELPNRAMYYLGDTNTILRPDSVTFVIPIRNEESVSPSQSIEITITREGFSSSILSA